MAEPEIIHKSGVGPLEWHVVQGAYLHATCRSMSVAEAALEAVKKDVAEHKRDADQAAAEQLDTIKLNADRHRESYPNSRQVKDEQTQAALLGEGNG